MSSILRALRRVEQEAPPPAETKLRDAVVAPAPGAPVVERRSPGSRALRSIAMAALVAFAALGVRPFVRWIEEQPATEPAARSAPPVSAAPGDSTAALPLASPPASPSAPPVESAPETRLGEHAAPLAFHEDAEPELGDEESSVAIAAPLRSEERLAAEEAREAAREAASVRPAPIDAFPQRSDVLAQPSPRRDLDAPRPTAQLDVEPEAAAPIDSVPIARREPPTRASGPLVRHAGIAPAVRAANAPAVAGTVWHPDAARRFARLKLASDGAIREAREGDEIDGWRIVRIDLSAVLLQHDDVQTLRRVGERAESADARAE